MITEISRFRVSANLFTGLLFSLSLSPLVSASTLYWNNNSPAAQVWGGTHWSTTPDGQPGASFVDEGDAVDSAVISRANPTINIVGKTERKVEGLSILNGATITSATGGNNNLTVLGAGSGNLNWNGQTAGYFRLNLSSESSAWVGTITDTSQNVLNTANWNTGSQITINSTAAVSAQTKIALNGTGALLLNTSTQNKTTTIGELSGTSAAAVIGIRNAGSNRLLRIEQATNTTYAGRIITDASNRTFGLEKSGSGRLRLTGGTADAPSSWNNGTKIEAGELYLNGVTSGQGRYLVQAGATLGGTGIIGLAEDQSIVIEDGGILNPGDVTDAGVHTSGTLTVRGSGTAAGLVFNGNATIRMNLSHDLIVLEGESMVGSFTGATGDAIVFDFGGSDIGLVGSTVDLISFGGTASGIDLSAFKVAGGWEGVFKYGGDGNLLQFEITAAVPEASTTALISVAIVAGGTLLLRRR